MFPVLLSIGNLTFYTSSLIIAVGFLISLFFFWKMARVEIVEVEKIFDFVLIGLIDALFFGRLMFILDKPDDFQMKFDRMIHIYKFPGFDFWGICFGFLIGIFYYAKKIKVKKTRLFDLIAVSFSLFLSFMFLAYFFDGVYVGSNSPLLGVRFVGYVGNRFPIQILASVAFFLFFLFSKRLVEKKVHGLIFWLFVTFAFFVFLILEFLRHDTIYFEGIAINKLLFFAVWLFSMMMLVIKYQAHLKAIFRKNL